MPVAPSRMMSKGVVREVISLLTHEFKCVTQSKHLQGPECDFLGFENCESRTRRNRCVFRVKVNSAWADCAEAMAFYIRNGLARGVDTGRRCVTDDRSPAGGLLGVNPDRVGVAVTQWHVRAADVAGDSLFPCMARSQRRTVQQKPSRGRAVQRREFSAGMQPGCSEDPSREDDDDMQSPAGSRPIVNISSMPADCVRICSLRTRHR